MRKLKKRSKKFHGKTMYLLGKNKEGELIWMEAPSWDCGWYWGFGYVEIFSKNGLAIHTHTHWDSAIVGKLEYYNYEKECWDQTEYIHHLNDNPNFEATTLTDNESWQLADYMQSFYILKEAAATLGWGNSHISGKAGNMVEDKAMSDKINKELLPHLFDAIILLLNPIKKAGE